MAFKTMTGGDRLRVSIDGEEKYINHIQWNSTVQNLGEEKEETKRNKSYTQRAHQDISKQHHPWDIPDNQQALPFLFSPLVELLNFKDKRVTMRIKMTTASISHKAYICALGEGSLCGLLRALR